MHDVYREAPHAHHAASFDWPGTAPQAADHRRRRAGRIRQNGAGGTGFARHCATATALQW